MSEENEAVVENANDATASGGEKATAAETSTPAATAPSEAEKPAESEATLMQGVKDETPTEADQQSQKEEKPDGAPESYEDFKAPEGIDLASPVVDSFKGVAKELDLSQEKAQTLIDKMTPILAARQVENIKRISAEWAERSKADPEIGGDKFAASMANVARVRETFARNADGQIDPDIAEFMSSPMGNHPGALKLLARAGAAISEASFPTGGKAESAGYTATDFYKDAKRG